MKDTFRIIVLLFLTIGAWDTVRADIVYPARLEIVETTPGRFRVTFILPIVNGMKPKAAPVLPEAFRDLTEHQISGTAASYIETWEVSGPPDSLYGQTVGVRGLIGTQIDVLLQIDLLNGRSYAETLMPGNALFVIPHPASPLVVFGEALRGGLRRVLSRPELLLLMLLLVFAGLDRRALLPFVLTFFLAHGAGQWLTGRQWMQLSPLWPALGVSLLAAGVSLSLYKDKVRDIAGLQPLWLWMAPIGAMYGTVGILTTEPVGAGLTDAEQGLQHAGINLGAGLGLVGMYWLWRALRQGIILSPRLAISNLATKRLWYFGGLLAFALFFYFSSSLIFYPSLLPEVPVAFFVTAVLAGVWLGAGDRLLPVWQPVLLAVLLAVGLILGVAGFSLPLGALVLAGAIFFLSAALVMPPMVGFRVQWALAGLALLFAGAQSGLYIQENLSFAVAQAVGVGVLAFLPGLLGFYISRHWRELLPGGLRSLGILGMLFAVLSRTVDYIGWFDQTVMTQLALGRIVLPLSSLLLLGLALIFRPRKRRVHQRLGMEMPRAFGHLILLGLAFFFLPVGVVAVKNPFFEASAPRDTQAARILEKVLTNTYQAFNLKEEEQLYDQLAESVSEALIADVYLDSRRRLTTGVREGAEVTVRDVSVESVGEEVGGAGPAEGFTYRCRWMVTARVRHLQHIHHRKNIYTGDLRIKVIDNQWKIDQISLTSEDRVIIPGSQGS